MRGVLCSYLRLISRCAIFIYSLEIGLFNLFIIRCATDVSQTSSDHMGYWSWIVNISIFQATRPSSGLGSCDRLKHSCRILGFTYSILGSFLKHISKDLISNPASHISSHPTSHRTCYPTSLQTCYPTSLSNSCFLRAWWSEWFIVDPPLRNPYKYLLMKKKCFLMLSYILVTT